MHPSPATVASVLLLLAALALVVVTVVAVRPQPPVVTTQAAPGTPPREHGREPRARPDKRRGAEARTARPAAVVRAYYRALDRGRFDDAWAVLSPPVRVTFGGFASWRDGYAATLSSTPRSLAVARRRGVATVAHELVALDRSPCGPVRRVFAVRWVLAAAAGRWRAARLSAAKLSGSEPAEACGARHDAAGVAGGS